MVAVVVVSSPMEPYIRSTDITLTFTPKNRDPVTALKDFRIELNSGEFVSIVGPSGCGKSTFLNVLLGLLKPDAGSMTESLRFARGVSEVTPPHPTWIPAFQAVSKP